MKAGGSIGFIAYALGAWLTAATSGVPSGNRSDEGSVRYFAAV